MEDSPLITMIKRECLLIPHKPKMLVVLWDEAGVGHYRGQRQKKESTENKTSHPSLSPRGLVRRNNDLW